MTTSNIVARRAVFDEVGVFDDLRYAHDLDFFLRLLSYRRRLVLLRRPLLTYRVHGGNAITEAPAQVKLETAVVAACFARREATAKDASGDLTIFLSRLSEITDRQGLTRVALSLLHAQREAPGELSPEACLADQAFRSALLDVA